MSPWAKKGQTFNEWMKHQILPHTRNERIQAVEALRKLRDMFKGKIR